MKNASLSRGFLALVLGFALAASAGAAEKRDVTFDTADGFTIHGTLYAGTIAKAVLCLPMLGRTRSTYEGLAEKLQADGYWVLAIDLRGHGQSVMLSGKRREVKDFGPGDFLAMDQDLDAALKFLRKETKVSAGQTAIVGASIGANLALRHAAANPGIHALVLLSPGFNYRGLATTDVVKKLAGVSVMFAASSDDAYSADTVRELAKATGVPKEIVILEKAGHGTTMFEKSPGFLDRVAAWLREKL